MEIPKIYESTKTESKWYDYWMKEGFFNSTPDDREAYTIVIPPPNVTGVLHMGHMLNNTIQDVLVRRARMMGKNACWVPGTDHASIATEAKVVEMLKAKGLDKKEIGREKFLEYAFEWKDKYGGIILNQLERLGASCDWDRTRFTMEDKLSEAVIDAFIHLHKEGMIYRGERLVNWDPVGLTALSDEEVIPEEKTLRLYYLNYPLVDDPTQFVTIATSRPETIMADVAICVHPEDERYLHLHGKKVRIPLIDREIPVIPDEYVSIDFGTGCLKITPAHDKNDFELGKKHGLEIIDILNPDARLNEKAQMFIGQDRFVARKNIAKELEEKGFLVKVDDYASQLNLSERTKAVVEPRISMQWFVDMKKFMEKNPQVLDAVMSDEIALVPPKFKNTYKHWLDNIKDWCISRQRTWTMPITSYIHKETGDLHPKTQAIMEKVAQAVEVNNMEAWYDFEDAELIGEDAKDYHKITDGLDVWFDSGVSHACVLGQNEDLHVPADLYLEGSDQHRGWFQSSLITSVAMNGHAPYKQVVTHGFTVDKNGHKMSKSLGNTVAPEKVINRLGVDIMRLWVSSIDFRNDQVVSDEILNRVADAYRRIRNTTRFLLANLNGFDPQKDIIAAKDMVALDRYIVRRALALQEDIVQSYEKLQFHQIYQLLHNFCSVDLVSFYLDIIKDRQYTAKQHTKAHQSAQTAMYYIVEMLVRWMTPIMPFTADEIWEHIPGQHDESVFITTWYNPTVASFGDAGFSDDYCGEIMLVKAEVMQCLEAARNEKLIGSGLDAHVVLYVNSHIFEALEKLGDELRVVLITSQASIQAINERTNTSTLTDLDGLAVEVKALKDAKCARCWQRRDDVGESSKHTELCGRCIVNIDAEGETRDYA